MQRWGKAAGLSPYELSVKTTRKNLESWMITVEVLESSVCLRQGHDSLKSMRHYQGLAFSEGGLKDIKRQLTAWVDYHFF